VPRRGRRLVSVTVRPVNIYAWVLLAAAAVAAVVDWAAVTTRRPAVEQLAKPAVVLLLGAFAWLLHADESTSGRWLLLALVLCLVGDLLLLSARDRAFGAGLAAFLLAHLAFVAVVVSLPRRDPVWVAVAVTAVVVALVLWRLLWPIARADLAEGGPPTVYALVLGAFVALAWWSGHRVLAVGATVFLVSDALLAAQRFRRPLPAGRLAVMVTYHVALAAVVVGVLRPDVAA
jgi:uncharacterized membrane protein YhhN